MAHCANEHVSTAPCGNEFVGRASRLCRVAAPGESSIENVLHMYEMSIWDDVDVDVDIGVVLHVNVRAGVSVDVAV